MWLAPKCAPSSGRSKGGGLSDPRLLRVILDTNILLSALIRRDSIPASLMRAWHQNRYDLLTHSLIAGATRCHTARAYSSVDSSSSGWAPRQSASGDSGHRGP